MLRITNHCAQSLSHIRLFVTLWTVAHQVPLSLSLTWETVNLYGASLVLQMVKNPPVLLISSLGLVWNMSTYL